MIHMFFHLTCSDGDTPWSSQSVLLANRNWIFNAIKRKNLSPGKEVCHLNGYTSFIFVDNVRIGSCFVHDKSINSPVLFKRNSENSWHAVERFLATQSYARDRKTFFHKCHHHIHQYNFYCIESLQLRLSQNCIISVFMLLNNRSSPPFCTVTRATSYVLCRNLQHICGQTFLVAFVVRVSQMRKVIMLSRVTSKRR